MDVFKSHMSLASPPPVDLEYMKSQAVILLLQSRFLLQLMQGQWCVKVLQVPSSKKILLYLTIVAMRRR
jgi:hypothetical protein